jgi:hypothetical protein
MQITCFCDISNTCEITHNWEMGVLPDCITIDYDSIIGFKLQLDEIDSNRGEFKTPESIVIPKSVMVISAQSFSGIHEEQVWMDVWEDRSWSDIRQISFECPVRLERIEAGAFKQAQMKSLVIPSSVRYLATGCFCMCTCTELFTFEPNLLLEEIGSRAFEKISIVSLSIPASVRILGSDCFRYCDRLYPRASIGSAAWSKSSENPSVFVSWLH